MNERIVIREVTPHNAAKITSIYNPYVTETVITFEEIPVTIAEMQSRIENLLNSGFPYIAAEKDNQMIGYAYAGQWRARSAYRHTVETSIYLAQENTGHGVGTILYKELLERLKRMEVHVVLGGITLPNPVSMQLHEKLGFTKVAHFNEAGYKFGRWLDVGFWQLIL